MRVKCPPMVVVVLVTPQTNDGSSAFRYMETYHTILDELIVEALSLFLSQTMIFINLSLEE